MRSHRRVMTLDLLWCEKHSEYHMVYVVYVNGHAIHFEVDLET